MAINPTNPSKKTDGNGSEKYTPPKGKTVPSEYDKIAEKVNQDNEKAKSDKAKADVSKMAAETRAKAEAERPRTYTERLQDMGRLPKSGSGGAGAGGDLEKGMMGGRLKKPSYCAGGKVSSASKRADGIAIRGKTRA